MAKSYERIDDGMARWLEAQPVFFVATAPLNPHGHVNVSPKGRQRLHVLDEHTVAYLDQTGSGAETIAHLKENGRIVVMGCAFEGPPRIVRLHGRGDVIERHDTRFAALAARLGDTVPAGTRAAIRIEVSRIADSCGYAVPLMTYVDDRENLEHWTATKGPDGLAAYQREKNSQSIDGLEALDADDDHAQI